MRRVLFVVLFAVISCRPDGHSTKPLDGLEVYVAKAIKDRQTPGLAMAVIKNGKSCSSTDSAPRELWKPDAVNEHTLFAIGSTTKAMTATLAAMLVDEKKLEWDAPVVRYPPWFQMKRPAVTPQLTISRPADAPRRPRERRPSLRIEPAHHHRRDPGGGCDSSIRRIRSAPGSSTRTSCVCAAAGAVVEAAGGKSWPDMIRTRIFEPLGMRTASPPRRSWSSGPTSPRRTPASAAASGSSRTSASIRSAAAGSSGRVSTTWPAG